MKTFKKWMPTLSFIMLFAVVFLMLDGKSWLQKMYAKAMPKKKNTVSVKVGDVSLQTQLPIDEATQVQTQKFY